MKTEGEVWRNRDGEVILVGGCKKPETPERKRVECTFR
jgi:hypothetical protein